MARNTTQRIKHNNSRVRAESYGVALQKFGVYGAQNAIDKKLSKDKNHAGKRTAIAQHLKGLRKAHKPWKAHGIKSLMQYKG